LTPHSRVSTALCIAVVLIGAAARADSTDDEIVITGNKQRLASLDLVGNTAKLDEDRIRLTNHQHVYELGAAAAGTWLSRGDGQEHLTAIRSPVLTGPGACGAFLILEDTVPTRPTGFCNVNQLFEVPSEIAHAVEIIRGPSNALYGSNGLHGTLNVLLPTPGNAPGWVGSVTAGPDRYYRGRLGWDGAVGASLVNVGLLADTYDGFREASGYDQQKGFLRLERPLTDSTIGLSLSLQNLEQETAGFIFGKDAYKDPALRVANLNPEAFRDANSQRIVMHWRPDDDHAWAGANLRTYLRRSDMQFLQHFIPGQPLEDNGQVSGGITGTLARPWRDGALTVGLDVEFMDAFIRQFQAEPLNGPSAFLNETLPQGWHYDFDTTSVMAAPYAQLEYPLADRWRVIAGVRLEYLRYDYDNKRLDGNTRDDGTPCGFGGCRYNRPADRADSFFNVAPNVGLSFRIDADTAAFATLSRGFRAPQVTELYRLQNNQTVADLDSVTLDSLEVGVRWQTDAYRLEATGFAMLKRDEIFQDADRNNISNGRTTHVGAEIQAGAQFESGLYAGLAATWARHRYDFNLTTTGDTILSGNDVDTAPRTLGSARIGWNGARALLELEGVHQGSYYLEPSNSNKYDGHNLLHARAVWRITDDWSLTGRVNNVSDKLYADRADFAFGNYRYLPGREREFFIEIAYRSF